MTDADLVYDGRARKRPPGASEMVQRIYLLLSEHPDGMTLDDLHAEMREGWLDTDAYRAYEQHRQYRAHYYLKAKAVRPEKITKRKAKAIPEYGSDEFKRQAQRWWISGRLDKMQRFKTVRRDGDRWHATAKKPLVPLDAAAKRQHDHADTQAHIRREELKAEISGLLADKRTSARVRPVLEDVLAYLRGR